MGRLTHYWDRESYDELMELIPGEAPVEYPIGTAAAVSELKLRGLRCEPPTLLKLVGDGKVDVAKIGEWSKAAIDAAAEVLYAAGAWDSWTHWCFVANARFGQVVKARRVASALFGLPFKFSFDCPGLVTVIEPGADGGEYSRVRFYPSGTQVSPVDQDAETALPF
jgi:hypothetical protein